MQGGISLDECLDMDLLSFWSLWRSLRRLDAADRIEGIWTLAITNQGTGKGIKDWAKRWEPLQFLEYDERPTAKGLGASDFFSDFPGGI